MHQNPYSAPQHSDVTRVGEEKGSRWLALVAPWVILAIAPLLLQLTDMFLPNARLPPSEWPETSWTDHWIGGLTWLQVPMAILSIVLAWRRMPLGRLRWLVTAVAVVSIPAMMFFGLAVVMDKTGKWL
jgi:hypothetical protein